MGAFRSRLVFSGATEVGIEQVAAVGSIEVRLNRSWTVSAAAGGVFSGRLLTPEGEVGMPRGAVASLGASLFALEQAGVRPFLMISGTLAFSAVDAAPGGYLAGAARLGVAAGWTLAERFTPYLAARAFGGPVFWRGESGTDRFHFQLGAGLVVGLPGGFDVSAEVVPLGEQRLSASVGRSF